MHTAKLTFAKAEHKNTTTELGTAESRCLQGPAVPVIVWTGVLSFHSASQDPTYTLTQYTGHCNAGRNTVESAL